MNSESRMYREPIESRQDAGNTVFRDGAEWKVRLSDGAEIVVPERLGKSMYVALDLLTTHLDRHKGWTSQGISNVFTEASLKRFDCHALVAYGIGALINLRFLKTLSYTANHLFFGKEDFKTCVTREEFEKLSEPLLQNEPIAVFQMLKEGSLSHGFFVFRGRSGLYVFYRGGSTGGVLFEKLDDSTWNELVAAYGNDFAGDSYSHLAQREDLKKYYAAFHSDA